MGDRGCSYTIMTPYVSTKSLMLKFLFENQMPFHSAFSVSMCENTSTGYGWTSKTCFQKVSKKLQASFLMHIRIPNGEFVKSSHVLNIVDRSSEKCTIRLSVFGKWVQPRVYFLFQSA